jgi:hypothetical protein
MNEEIKSDTSLGNVCYLTVQSGLPYCLLSKIIGIKIHGTLILSVVLHGCSRIR